jgi:hypothetical protein
MSINDFDGEYDDFTGNAGQLFFANPGIYPISVRVTDDDGGEAFAAFHVTINPPHRQFKRADPNIDIKADISDAITVLGHLFLGSPQELICEKSADANDDGSLDISDAVFILDFLFLGGNAPSEPHLVCGVDPTPDTLTCWSYAICP